MRIISLGILASLVLGMNSGGLFAQESNPKAPAGSTPHILADIETARVESNKKLEVAFQKAIQAVEKSESISRGRSAMVISNLKASQVAWQDFRRKQCSFLYSYYYEEIGSLGARAAGIWEYESHLIDQRIKELEDPPNYF